MTSGLDQSVVIGIMQRCFPLNPLTQKRLADLAVPTIIVDSSPTPIAQGRGSISVVHKPDADGFFPIYLLGCLFSEFLKTSGSRLLLLEGDMLPTRETLQRAAEAANNTKALYVESDPSSPFAYMRREGLAGVLLRAEVERMAAWFSHQPADRLRRYEGYCDSFLWYSVSSETTGYSVSTAGPEWIPVTHLTHDDATRVTKKQRHDMKIYRRRHAEVIMMAMECNAYAAGSTKSLS